MSIISHETSNTHIEATLARKIRDASLPILPAIKEMKTMEVARNRLIVKQLIDITLFLGRHCLAFRGHREILTSRLRGNFKDLVVLLAEHSHTMATYLTALTVTRKMKSPVLFVMATTKPVDRYHLYLP